MRMIFIGPPGAGKGTQAEKILVRYPVAHLSTGDMLRAARDAKTEVGLKAEQYMLSGQLVPDDVLVDMIADRLGELDCRNGYLLDGFPRTIAQADALGVMLQKKRTPLHVVLELKVPEEELFRRLAGRGRADDRPDVIQQRLNAYARQTTPLIEYYAGAGLLRSIDGLGSADEIFSEIIKVLDAVSASLTAEK